MNFMPISLTKKAYFNAKSIKSNCAYRSFFKYEKL